MTKSDLIKALSDEIQITTGDAAGVVSTILEAMTSTLVQGENIEIRGFGSFTIKHYDAFESRNPRTKERVIAKAKKKPFFRPGKDLRESVNADSNSRKPMGKKSSRMG